MVEIVVEKGGVEIHRFPVEGDLTIGRAAHAQVRLDDMRVHRAHARLLWQGGHLCLLDLDTSNGTMLDGRRIHGIVRFERTARVEIGPFTLKRSDGDVVNPALDESTGSDEDSGLHAAVTPRAEVLDAAALEASLPRVRVGRHFVFIDDAQQALLSRGRQRLTAYKQRRGRAVKALADAAVDVAGARIHAAPFDVERLAGLSCDREVYRAGHDVAHLIVAMPGGGRATLRITHEGAPFFSREIDVGRGVAVEPVPLLEPGRYLARLEVGGAVVGEAVSFQACVLGSIAPTADRPVNVGAVAPGGGALHPRGERTSTLAGELGKELTVALDPPRDGPRAVLVRGLHLSRRDHLATPIVVDDVVAERASFRAVEDVECLVVAAFDPARDAFTVFELGDVARGECAEVEVARPMCVAFVGCFVNGEPFEAFTALFAPEKPIAIAVPATVVPGGDITVRVRTDRAWSVPVVVTVRDAGPSRAARGASVAANAASSPLAPLAASAKRAIAAASTGLGDEFKYAPLADILPPPTAALALPHEREEPSSSAPRPSSPTPFAAASFEAGELMLKIHERGGAMRAEPFDKNEVAIGRVATNDVVLAKANVSKQHARLVLREGRLVVVDLKSTNGTWVNGKRIVAPLVLKARDRITIGDFTLELEMLPATSSLPRPSRAPRDDDDEDLFGDGPSFDEDATKALRSVPPAKASGVPTALGGAVARAVRDASLCERIPGVLFCGVLDVVDGAELRFPVASGGTSAGYTVECFFVDGGDFGEARAHVEVTDTVSLGLQVAPEIGDDEGALGVVRVEGAVSARVRLRRDGRDATLRHRDGRAVSTSDALPSGSELVFDAGAGTWLASVEDASSNATSSTEVRVGVPGVRRFVSRQLLLLDRGKSVALADDVLSLRVLAGIDAPLEALACSLADDAGECERASARVLASTVLLGVDDASVRARAEGTLLLGVERLRTTWRKGRGFARSRAHSGASERASPMIVRHLWALDAVDVSSSRNQSTALADAVRDGLAMAADVATALGMQRVPDRVESLEDACLVAVREPRRQREVLEHIARAVVVDDAGPRLRHPQRGIDDRVGLAYAAAALLAAGKVQTALRIANEFLERSRDLGSTAEATATLALLVRLKRAGLSGGDVVINGERAAAQAAAAWAERVERVDARDAVCLVEVSRAREERWAEATGAFPVQAGLCDGAGRPTTKLRKGDRVELVVSLPRGAVDGDVVDVCLPTALAPIAWAETRRVRVDFAGRDEARLPLVVVEELAGRQRFALAVRNVFEEERAASPGLIVIERA